MSVRTKLLVVALAVSTAFSAASVFMQRAMMLPEFDRIEKERASDCVARCLFAIQRDADFLGAMASDYAAWDDTYQFVVDRNQAYIDANLIPETFKNLHANLIAIVGIDGKLVYGEMREDQGGEVIANEKVLAALASPDHVLVRHTDANGRVSGVIQTELGPMLVGAAAITTSKRDGEMRGSVIMARFVNDETSKALAEATRVDARVTPVEKLSSPERSALGRCAGELRMWSDRSADAQIVSYASIPDVFGEPAMLLTSVLPRKISQRAAVVTQFTTLLAIAGGVAMLAVLWLAIYRGVVAPLAKLSAHAVRVGRDNDLSARLNNGSPDEIGVLSREFDRMVDQLAHTQEQLLDIAHKAGKAQVAVDVLHNVGNVLNSVTVSANLVQGKLRDSEVGTVGMAADLLQQNKADIGRFMSEDDRGKQLPDFLQQLSHHLAAEQASMLQEMATVSHAIEHIRTIVSSQQQHSQAQQLIERLSVPKLVDSAIALAADSLHRHEIVVSSTHEGREAALLDKHRVMQILVNLITNAKHALRDRAGGQRRIDVQSRVTTNDNADSLEITVRDNGVGIDPSKQTQIFEMGYSTRSDGSGVGLHSCANLAAEMGGSLTVVSDGIGTGAAFTLRIPIESGQVQA